MRYCQIVEPEVHFLYAPEYEDVVRKIERAGRTCYQSMDKCDGTIKGAENFVRRMIKRGHESVIEHEVLTLKIITDRAIANEMVRHRLASYCVSGDTEVFTDLSNRDVRKRTVRELFEMPQQYLDMTHIRSVNLDTKELISNKIKNVYKTGKKEVYKVTTNLGYEIKTTLEHQFYTDNGWKRLKEISVGDEVYTNGELAYRNKEWLNRKYNIENLRQEDIANLCGEGAVVKVIRKDTIKSIERIGLEETYDIEMEAPHHNFIGNGFVVHNSQQSTRYVGYKDKVKVIKPSNLKETNEIMWEDMIDSLCGNYLNLAQEESLDVARSLLPNCTATEIVITMNMRELRHFIKLRTGPGVHKDMKDLANYILNECYKYYPVFFEDLIDRKDVAY